MDVLSFSQMSNPSQRLLDLDNQGDSADNWTPIFPSPNFEVPDISFSNSVSPNADFHQSWLSSSQMYGHACVLYMNQNIQSVDLMGEDNQTSSQQHQSLRDTDKVGQQMAGLSHQGVNYFPPAPSSSPDGTSSCDSDVRPPSQPASRTTSGSTGRSIEMYSSATQPSSQTADRVSIEDNQTTGGASKKAKPCKRKKRKDPNEPQKPVSAYALFFRDSQASIKGHNPTASFGEVSKIVASMWDQLDPENKEVYKKKTEMAKKQYLKQLAAYRASQVSQSAPEEVKKAPSPSGLGNLALGNMSSPASFQALGGAPSQESHVPLSMSVHMNHQRLQQPPAHMMQMSPQMVSHQHHHQMHNQQHLLQLQHISMGQTSPSSSSHQQHSPSQQQQSPVPGGPMYTCVGQMGPTNYQPAIVTHGSFGRLDQERSMDEVYHPNLDETYRQCIRAGCRNYVRGQPGWESEYCSSDCAIGQCRDVFTSWTASRPTSNTFPVK